MNERDYAPASNAITRNIQARINVLRQRRKRRERQWLGVMLMYGIGVALNPLMLYGSTATALLTVAGVVLSVALMCKACDDAPAVQSCLLALSGFSVTTWLVERVETTEMYGMFAMLGLSGLLLGWRIAHNDDDDVDLNRHNAWESEER